MRYSHSTRMAKVLERSQFAPEKSACYWEAAEKTSGICHKRFSYHIVLTWYLITWNFRETLNSRFLLKSREWSDAKNKCRERIMTRTITWNSMSIIKKEITSLFTPGKWISNGGVSSEDVLSPGAKLWITGHRALLGENGHLWNERKLSETKTIYKAKQNWLKGFGIF